MVLDVLLILQLYLARRMILGLVYTFQIKIEFTVLNRFIDFRQTGQSYLRSRLDCGITETDASRISVLPKRSRGLVSIGMEDINHHPDSVGIVTGKFHLDKSRVSCVE